MKLERYLTDGKKLEGTMIGYGIDEQPIKKLQKYISSWFIRHKVKHEIVDKPHISIAQIPERYEKDELVRTINTIKKGIIFDPKEVIILRGKDGKTNYIVIEYKVNFDFIDAFKKIDDNYAVRYFSSIKPHISLVTIKGDIPDNIWYDIMYSMPPLPKVKAKEVELWNKDFEIEFKK
jgi:hypothetical protein